MKLFRIIRPFLLAALFVTALSLPFALHAADTVATTTAATGDTREFVPLTQLPGIQDVSGQDSFPNFLNELYKILIGVAAVLAVLMIMYAGVQFMTSRGSVSSNEAAKSRIQNAILGLILVLSPTIVFSIINPDILKLDINFSALQPTDLGTVDTSAAPNVASSSDPAYLFVAKWNLTPKSGTNGTACVEYTNPLYYASQADCTAGQANIASYVKYDSSNYEYSNLSYLENCAFVPNKSYTLPSDPKSCTALNAAALAAQPQSGYIWSYQTLNGSYSGSLSSTNAECVAKKNAWDTENPGVKAVATSVCTCGSVQTRSACHI